MSDSIHNSTNVINHEILAELLVYHNGHKASLLSIVVYY